ncbi:hypothetical protein GGTG_02872 [Gaeumannomyces tritici R3-111a-1]|uniref:Glycosyltransferase 2 n=1 Tax=Gaeumannomyces tritici (strain R3-111a-1) TaxID=644352 RepID=J3NNL5_GAET3|nr:hypothetical protein GGTG_02872 [Gaeumannomyces tritici R3-111a-1]EJT77767.1 hypothetical protein GGTG_02872 [Gaeumannomyces tritici R3-111a-1]
MPKLRSLFLSDEEMGKKDDDHRAEKDTGAGLAAWAPARIQPTQPRRFLKRLCILIAVAILVYEFIDNMPTDVPIRDRRHPQYVPQDSGPIRPPPASAPAVPDRLPDSMDPVTHRGPKKPAASSEKAPVAASQDAAHPVRDYNGPIKFEKLAETLHVIGETRGAYPLNKNVLFAAANLKSAATLLPIACQMGSELRSYVHFALLARSEIPPAEVMKVNGIDESCHIIFHDARPNFASRSMDKRLSESTSKVFAHIYNYMHPQVVIIDNPANEEASFLKGLRKQSATTPMPIIELPARGAEKLSWMAKLDSQSLKVWNDVSIDIIIPAAPGGGSLTRLLKSLGAADYLSSSPPHITVELSHDVDISTQKFLQDFQWPPPHSESGVHARYLSIRHRIPRKKLDEEESSARFLESFWPAKPSSSHILILSPDTELSPNFFDYLRYSILTYQYSIAAHIQQWNSRLFGFSLELPSVHLDGSRPFSLPPRRGSTDGPSLSDAPTSFLWEAPSSNAVLILGDKWVELHGFVSKVLVIQSGMAGTPRLLAEKLVSKRQPAWLEQALRLCRARGYLTLYPSRETSSQLVTVHTETYVPPEEYANDVPKGTGRHAADSSDGVSAHSRAPLLDILHDGGELPQLYDLPMVSWDGAPTESAGLDDRAAKYAADFRREVGGCLNDRSGLPQDRSAADLFCGPRKQHHV